MRSPGLAPIIFDMRSLVIRRERADARFELHTPRFTLRAGEFVAVVGESGSGKSTLMDALALARRPNGVATMRLSPRGRPAVDLAALWQKGRAADATLAALRARHFGYVVQVGGLLPFLSVRANAMLTPGADTRASASRLMGLARSLGIERLLEAKPDALSIGQRQRAAILRALAHEPDVVLADEPTASVDPLRAARIVEDLGRMARDSGTAIVFVTHQYDLIANRAQRCYVTTTEERDDGTIHAVCEEMSRSARR